MLEEMSWLEFDWAKIIVIETEMALNRRRLRA